MEAIPVVNDNEASIDTGITLDSMPFIFLFLTSAAAALLMLTKRRYTGKF